MRTNEVLIIIPAYNEAENIEKVVDNIIENYPQYDYIIVNDGSSDSTRDVCRKRGYQYLNLSINLGIGGAVQTGYKYAKDKGYEIAVQIDGDGQHDIAYLERMLPYLENDEVDIIIGSRFIEKEGFQSSTARRSGIKILSILIKLCTGYKIKDVTSGFRAVNRHFIDIYSKDYPIDYPEPEAIVAAVMHGGRIMEYPVIMRERESGISSINLLKSIYYMIKVTLAILVCRLSFGIRRSPDALKRKKDFLG
ncbi:MAG: glycosyltransferase family 2 protein [Lachnospiraceae bacterium]|nr:glycosyltransferase family 2 protein [Lachnospiraceae bacterium]